MTDEEVANRLKNLAMQQRMSVDQFLRQLQYDSLSHEQKLEIRQEAHQLAGMITKQWSKMPSIDPETAIDWKENFRKLFNIYEGLRPLIGRNKLNETSDLKTELRFGNRKLKGKAVDEFADVFTTHIYLYILNNKAEIIGEKDTLEDYVQEIDRLAKLDPKFYDRLNEIMKTIMSVGRNGDEQDLRKKLQALRSDYKYKDIVEFLNQDLMGVIAYYNLAQATGNHKLFFKQMKFAFNNKKNEKEFSLMEVWSKTKESTEFSEAPRRGLNYTGKKKNHKANKKKKEDTEQIQMEIVDEMLEESSELDSE